MKKILLANQPTIKDPILNAFVERSTTIILASINQSLLNAVDPKRYKLKEEKMLVGGVRKVTYQSSSSLILNHISAQKSTNFRRDIKRISRQSLYTLDRKYLTGTHIDLTSSTPILKDDKSIKTIFADVPLKLLSKKYLLDFLLNFAQDQDDSPTDPIVQNKGIKIKLKEVKCLDETNPERWGSDEIAMGAVFLDPAGNTTILPEFFVGNNFDDGDVKSYTPHKLLNSFNITSAAYPHFYSAYLTLAEKDNGGLSNFISDLYISIKAETQVILAALGVAAGAAIGAEIGGSIGTAVGGPIGTIIGIAAGAILGAVIAALVNALKDDIFLPQMASLTIPSISSSFSSGSLTSPTKELIFEGHGGKYRIKYYWEIIR